MSYSHRSSGNSGSRVNPVNAQFQRPVRLGGREPHAGTTAHRLTSRLHKVEGGKQLLEEHDDVVAVMGIRKEPPPPLSSFSMTMVRELKEQLSLAVGTHTAGGKVVKRPTKNDCLQFAAQLGVSLSTVKRILEKDDDAPLKVQVTEVRVGIVDRHADAYERLRYLYSLDMSGVEVSERAYAECRAVLREGRASEQAEPEDATI